MSQRDHPGAELEYDESLDALAVKVSGERTVTLGKALMAEILNRVREHGTNRLLFDVRDAVYPLGIEDSIEAFREISKGVQGLHVALVFDPGQREKGVVMQTTGSLSWNLVRLFHDPMAADAWLRETMDGADGNENGGP